LKKKERGVGKTKDGKLEGGIEKNRRIGREGRYKEPREQKRKERKRKKNKRKKREKLEQKKGGKRRER